MRKTGNLLKAGLLVLAAIESGSATRAQVASRPVMPAVTVSPNDALISPVVNPDRRVTFRVYAPKAASVQLTGEMLAWDEKLPAFSRGTDGVWTYVSPPLRPGAYRYTFLIDGMQVLDSRNVKASYAQHEIRSLVVVSNGDFAADRPTVAHGAIATVRYFSKAVGMERQMRVYMPPNYDPKGKPLPVLYLLHGGGDSDDSWPTVGRAGTILDNLITDGKALPMIVVMPTGTIGDKGQPFTWNWQADPFSADLLTEIMPVVEMRYNVDRRPEKTALAGLSMGGIQTLNIGLTHTDRFRWLGVFSSGWFPEERADFDKNFGAGLHAASTRLQLFYYTNGDADISTPYAKEIYKMFDRRGVKYEAHETVGGHTWETWRLNLYEFAPRLFR